MSKQVDDFAHPQPPVPLWDVLLIPSGASVFTIAPTQTQRITVQAENRVAIDWHPDVRAFLAVGWAVGEAIPSGRPSTLMFEIRARAQRAEFEASGEVPDYVRASPNYRPRGVMNFDTMPASQPTPAPPYRKG